MDEPTDSSPKPEDASPKQPGIHQLLKFMVENKASDLHITPGTPPQMRIDGSLKPLNLPTLTPPETKKIAYSLLTDAQKHIFEEDKELDFSFGVKGLSRFRANVFQTRDGIGDGDRQSAYGRAD